MGMQLLILLWVPLLGGELKKTPPAAAQAYGTTIEVPPRLDPARCRFPEYPIRARREKHEGTVLLFVNVSMLGSASEVRIATSSGFEILDNAAKESVEKWKFFPATRDGKAINSSIRIPLEFRLETLKK